MELNEGKIRVMRHALGIDLWKKPERKNNKLVAYRNHYCAQNPSKEFTWWEELVKDKLANRLTDSVNGFVYYGVSELGVAELERAIEEKIILKD